MFKKLFLYFLLFFFCQLFFPSINVIAISNEDGYLIFIPFHVFLFILSFSPHQQHLQMPFSSRPIIIVTLSKQKTVYLDEPSVLRFTSAISSSSRSCSSCSSSFSSFSSFFNFFFNLYFDTQDSMRFNSFD